MKSMKEQYSKLVDETRRLTGIDVVYARTRKFENVLTKACFINVMSRYFGATTLAIGGILKIHHSTVIHHLNAHGNRYKQEEQYAKLYDSLCKYAMTNESAPIDVAHMLNIMRVSMSL